MCMCVPFPPSAQSVSPAAIAFHLIVHEVMNKRYFIFFLALRLHDIEIYFSLSSPFSLPRARKLSSPFRPSSYVDVLLLFLIEARRDASHASHHLSHSIVIAPVNLFFHFIPFQLGASWRAEGISESEKTYWLSNSK